jgi:hypothetical protein
VIVLVLASLTVPLASALLLVRATLRAPWALLLSLAVLVGFGSSSLTFTLTLFLFDGSLLALWLLDLSVLAVAVAVYVRREPPPSVAVTSQMQPIHWVLVSCLALAAGAAVTIFIVNTIATPHGEWDAWAIWNMRARFLSEAGPQWRAAFDERLAWSHPDYPLLLPSLVARAWLQLGSTPTVVPASVAFLFAAAALGILYGALSTLRGRSQALLGSLCLVGTLTFVQAAATQLADLPVGCLLLATCAMLAFHWRGGDRMSAFWAGFLCAMAAWTKNEGALFMVCVFVVAAFRVLRARRVGAEAWPFLTGLAPTLIVLAVFKIRLAPSSYLFAEGGGQILMQILTPARYVEIGYAFATAVVRLGGWLGAALVAYAILMGGTRDEDSRRASLAVAGLVTLMLAGLFAVYVITPKDLAWQLQFSLDRLLLQLWPSALLAFFLFTAEPTEATSRR